MSEKLVKHYFEGGRAISAIQAEVAAAPRLPLYARPLAAVAVCEIEFERALRRGPQWRCNGCGWLDPRAYSEAPRKCPHCEGQEKLFHTMQRAGNDPQKEDQYILPGRRREWYLATAERCGMPPLTEIP